MKLLRFFVIAGICLCSAFSGANAAPARFWISTACLPDATGCTDPIDPAVDVVGPDVSTIRAVQGVEHTLYIWAQPAEGMTLQSFSLNLVIPEHLLVDEPAVDFLEGKIDPVVDIVDDKIKVYNRVGERQRYQYVYDSYGPLPPHLELPLKSNSELKQVRDEHLVDGIGGKDRGRGHDIQGFSVASGGYIGIGDHNDPLSAMTTDGRAWLVASVAFQTVRPSGTNPYYLQIGDNGMVNHDGSATQVQFGTSDESFIYDAGNVSKDRQSTDHDERPHVWITAVPALPTLPGDYYGGDGMVGPEDYFNWSATFGKVVERQGSGADGNGSGLVDAADYVLWRKHVIGDYDRDGSISANDYGEWTRDFGQSATHVGTEADGNGDGFVDAADYVTWRNVLNPVVQGDYIRNAIVGPEDYDAWKASFGQTVIAGSASDGSVNGLTDAADYVLWRKAFADRGNNGSLDRGTVPEPPALYLLSFAGIVLGIGQRRINRI